MSWARNRKMTVQSLSICSLFFFTNGGYFIIQIGRLLQYESFGRSLAGWIFPFPMCMPPLIPFLCLSTLQDLKQKLKMLIPWRRRTAVVMFFYVHFLLRMVEQS
jgi:hypothetical protein